MHPSASSVAHILLVDDDEDDRFLTSEAFRQHFPNSNITFVEDGEQLIDYLTYQGDFNNATHALPELILLDLNMPRKDGRQALLELKADSRFRHIPIVIMTTSEAKEDVATSYANGANSFISKPATYQQLSEMAKTIGHYWFQVATILSE